MNQPDLFSNHTIAGKTATSREAALRALPRSGSQRARILDLFLAVNKTGWIDEEIEQWLGIGANSERPRRKELQEGGWIEDSGRRRQTRSGAMAIVWVATPKALRECA